MRKVRNWFVSLVIAIGMTGCYWPTSIDSGEVGVIKYWG